jgi:bifunctional non-homologous end joining protein LigD
MAVSTTIDKQKKEVKLTNLDRVLWPESGITKRDLINYYASVFPYIQPHLANRPLVFTRYPSGINEDSFYQKNAPSYLPEWINTFSWTESDGTVKRYILAEAREDMIWLANQACIEIHPWLSQISSVEYPDFIVFDLDPSDQNKFEQIVSIAALLKQLMDQFGLRVYLKTSGSKGLHIYLPVVPRYSYEQVRQFGHAVANVICNVVPDIATIERPLRKRGNRIYVDYLQNGLGKTVCSPYSVRPRENATVSTPLHWEELTRINPGEFTIFTILNRLENIGDIFHEVLNDRQELENAAQMLSIALT